MIKVNFENISVALDNIVVINGVEFKMTDDITSSIIDFVKKAMETGEAQLTSQPKAEKAAEPKVGGITKAKKQPKAEPVQAPSDKAASDEFPELGKPTDIVGCVTGYVIPDGHSKGNSYYIRTWEAGFMPKKVKYAIKQTAIDKFGARWNTTVKAWQFDKKASYDAFIKAQKSR